MLKYKIDKMKILQLRILVLLFCSVLLSVAHLNAQNKLEVEGDIRVKDKLIINTTAPGGGEYIEGTSDLGLRFYTGFLEQMRVRSQIDGGDIQIFNMDTITTIQDTTAGNIVRLSDGTLAVRQYKIGDLAHGGIIFWVDETGEHGLVSSLEDLEPASGNFTHQWSTAFEVTAAQDRGLNEGAMNTFFIISAQRSDDDSAARLCADLDDGGYADWYMPSVEELDLLYTNLHQAGLGGFGDTFYWASTEFDNFNAWGQNFLNGEQNFLFNKNLNFQVRAIRAF